VRGPLSYGRTGPLQPAAATGRTPCSGRRWDTSRSGAGFFALGGYAVRGLSYGWGLAKFIADFACLAGMRPAVRRTGERRMAGARLR